MANPKNVTLPTPDDGFDYHLLPVIPAGRVYLDFAREMNVKMGCTVGMRMFYPSEHTAAIRDGTYMYGLRQCGGDGGALGKDTPMPTKRAGVIERCQAIDNGTHRYGTGGGGSALSTLIVVLREKVYKELRKLGEVKANHTKAVTADAEEAFRFVSTATAASMRKATDKENRKNIKDANVHKILWGNLKAEAEIEATRRDNEADGPAGAADEKTLADIMALATAPASDVEQAA